MNYPETIHLQIWYIYIYIYTLELIGLQKNLFLG